MFVFQINPSLCLFSRK